MFGYIIAEKPELRIKEFDMYKAIYCSLCKTLGKKYGLIARFSLSYDFTFLALLTLGLNDGCDELKKGCCVHNPLKKCNYLKNKNNLNFTAAAAAILLYFKFKDNIYDEKGIKKLFYMLLCFLHKRHYKKAANEYPNINNIIKNYINLQNTNEEKIKNNCSFNYIDFAAEPTAIMMSQLFESLSLNPKDKSALKVMGYNMGKWIYLTDCLADIEKDNKLNRFNPLLYEIKQNNNFKPTIKDSYKRLKNSLDFCNIEAAKAFELVTIYKYKNILGNILYLGMPKAIKILIKEQQ